MSRLTRLRYREIEDSRKTEVMIAERKREGVIEREEWYGIEESTRRPRSWRKGCKVESIVI